METWREELYHSATFTGGNWRNELRHFGIFGQKHGLRRFQNYDGSLTPEGRKRYGVGDPRKPKDEADVDREAHAAAKKAGLDQGDNYKIYARAQAGDKEAQKIIDQWERKPKASDRQINEAGNIVRNTMYNKDPSRQIFRILGADEKKVDEAEEMCKEWLDAAKENTKVYNEMFKELERNKGTRHYYEAVSEIASDAKYYGGFDKMTLRKISDASFMGIFEDGQQSPINAKSMYAYKNGLAEKCYELDSKYNDAHKKLTENVKAKLNEGLERVGATEYTNQSGAKRSLADALTMHMYNKYDDDWESTKGNYLLGEAAHSKSFDATDKKCIEKAENFAKNLKNNNDENTWYLLAEASENLGMDDIRAEDLTSSDWKKLNEEISRLRR